MLPVRTLGRLVRFLNLRAVSDRTSRYRSSEPGHQRVPGNRRALRGRGLGVAAARAGAGRVEEEIRNRLGAVRLGVARRGVIGHQQDAVRLAGPASSASTTGPMTSVSQRSSASTLMSERPWCPASSVASMCNTNRSRSPSDVMHARGLGAVVVVETGGRAGYVDDLDAGQHTETLHEIDCRRHARRARRTSSRTTAARASRPGPTTRSGSRASRPRARRRGRRRATRPSARCTLRRGRAGREDGGLAGEIVRRRALGVGPGVGARHTDGGTRRRDGSARRRGRRRAPASSAATIAWLCSLVGCPAAKSTMTGWASSESVTRLHRYATSPGASSTPIAAASIGARPVW